MVGRKGKLRTETVSLVDGKGKGKGGQSTGGEEGDETGDREIKETTGDKTAGKGRAGKDRGGKERAGTETAAKIVAGKKIAGGNESVEYWWYFRGQIPGRAVNASRGRER